jgi:hypothetical protein
MSKTKIERIEGIDEKIAQLEAQKKQLIQQQKAAERKERTRRLCSRHGLLEKYMPDLIAISDEQFEIFVKRGVDTSYGQKLLAELVAKQSVNTPSNSTASDGKVKNTTVIEEESEGFQDYDESEDDD